MKKQLLVLAAIVAIAVCGISVSTRSQAPTPVYPIIKANVVYQNQMSTLPTTAIFTPADGDGTYRISVYVDWPVATADPGSVADVDVTWKDDNQSANFDLQFGANSSPCPGAICTEGGFSQGTTVARVKGATPISFAVSGSDLPVPYNLYLVVEKLKPLS